MSLLYFDIETIPASEELREAAIEAERKKQKNQDVEDEEALYRESALSGTFGRVLCIGYAIDNEAPKIIYDKEGREDRVLKTWWEIAAEARKLVGHGIIEFDIPFLYQRSIVNGVRPSLVLPVKKFQTPNIFDTNKEWGRWEFRNSVSLHNLALALGIKSPKEEMSGSEVYDYYKDGDEKKINRILHYCAGDVETVRSVYRRMTFTDVETTQELSPGHISKEQM